MLRALVTELAGHGVTLVLDDVPPPVMTELERDALIDAIGRDHVFDGHSTSSSPRTRRCRPPPRRVAAHRSTGAPRPEAGSSPAS